VSQAVPKRRLRLYLRTTARQVAVGVVVTDRRGRAQLAFRLPKLTADVYSPAACCSRGSLVKGRGLLSVRALPPTGFGPLGAPGCSPASPRNREGTGPTQSEVFATAAGAELWALGATQVEGETAALDGVIGTEKKIVFRMTSGIPTNIYAVAPRGTRVPLFWGPSPHRNSDWQRPGYEWGAGFIFTEPGCWRIHAGSAPAQGDIWLLIRS
jgi:hypothetical protein